MIAYFFYQKYAKRPDDNVNNSDCNCDTFADCVAAVRLFEPIMAEVLLVS